jgi:hypothetical protein
MTSSAAILQQLGARVRPAGYPDAATPADGVRLGQSQGADAFAALLAKAKSGAGTEFASGRAVTSIPKDGIALTSEQSSSLERAADQAEAAGLKRVLVMLDDAEFVLDVSSRTVSRPEDDEGVSDSAAESGVIDGIDGVVDARTPKNSEQLLGMPGVLGANASLLAALTKIGVTK